MPTGSALETSAASLEEADRQLALLADVMLDEEDDVAAWVVAARRAVTYARHEDDDE